MDGSIKYQFHKALREREVIFRDDEAYARWRKHVDWLKRDLGANGQLDPIILTLRTHKGYADREVVHPGVSRMQAAKEIGWTWLWAEVRDERVL